MRNHGTAPGACTDVEFIFSSEALSGRLTFDIEWHHPLDSVLYKTDCRVDVGDVVTILMSEAKYVKPMHF